MTDRPINAMPISGMIVFLIGMTLLLPVGNVCAQGPANSAWPMFHQDVQRTGESNAVSPLSVGSQKWNYPVDGAIYSSPAIATDGTVYFGSDNHYLYALTSAGALRWRYLTGGEVRSSPAVASTGAIYVGSADKYLYAINSDGTLKWKYLTDAAIGSSPTIGSDGTVYVGSDDNNLYAVNPEGDLKWKFLTGGRVQSSPAIGADGTIYVGSADNYLYAIDTDGTLKWSFPAPGSGGGIVSSPSIATDGTVFIGSGPNLYAVNQDGTLRWKYRAEGAIASSPAVASDNTVYAGSDDKYLHAINPDGTLKWKYLTDGVVQSSAAITSDGTIYFGSDDSGLYALTSEGELKWKTGVGGAVRSSPAIASDGTVYFGSNDGSLYALGHIRLLSPNGGESWTAKTVHPITWVSSGITYVKLEYSSNNGTSWTTIVSSASGASGTYSWTLPNTPSTQYLVRASNYSSSTSKDVSDAVFTVVPPSITVTAPSGGEFWRAGTPHAITWSSLGVTSVKLEYSTNSGSTWTTIVASTGAASGTYTWTVPDTQSTQCFVRISDTSNATIKAQNATAFIIMPPSGLADSAWPMFRQNLLRSGAGFGKTQAADSVRWTLRGGTTLSSPALGSNGIMYAGSIDRNLYAVTVNGDLEWLLQTGGPVYSSPAVAYDGTIYAGSYDYSLYAVAPDGNLKWKYQTGDKVYSSPAVGPDGTVYFGSDDTYIYALTSAGGLKWKFKTEDRVQSSPAIDENRVVYFGSDDGYLYAISSGGSLKWKFRTNGGVHSSPALGADGTVYVGSKDNCLYAVTPTGGLKWKYQTGNSIYSSPAVASDGTVYVGSYDGYLYAVTTSGSLKWKVRTEDRVHSSPAVGADGTVYFGSDDTHMYAVAPSGKLLWKYQTGGKVQTSPAIDVDGSLYAGSSDNNLYAFAPGAKRIVLTSPVDGDIWGIGTAQAITWTSAFVANVKIEYSTNNGATWSTVKTSISASARSYAWTVPNTPSAQCMVRISDVSDASVACQNDTSFTIQGTLKVTSPKGGESWAAGSTHSITWTSAGVTNVKLEYSTDSGTSWTTIVSSTRASNGSYSWKAPSLSSTRCLVRITDTANPAVSARSDAVFTIPGTVTVTSPNGGESWAGGSRRTISWTAPGIANVMIECSADSGATWTTISESTGASAGSYSWTLPYIAGTRYIIRVSNAADLSVSDQSNAPFTILPSMTLTAPNGGESWTAGTVQTIAWLSYGVANVKLQYSLNNGSTWTTITASTGAGMGSYSWMVPGTPGEKCLVRVIDASNASLYDQSNSPFTIPAPLQVTSPNGYEHWNAGAVHPITWTSAVIKTVRIEYTLDGINWRIVAPSADADSGRYSWTIPASDTTSFGRIRITDTENDFISDTGDDPFCIIPPSAVPKELSLSSPNGGESWASGTPCSIAWTSSGVERVKIEYSTDSGSTWTIIAESADAASGSCMWLAADTESEQCLVRIRDASDATVRDRSDTAFTIRPVTVTLTAPNGGEQWVSGRTCPVTWTQRNVSAVRIEYSVDSGASWELVTESADADTGSYAWTIPESVSGRCLLRATDIANAAVRDSSDAEFTILPPAYLRLTSPVGGEVWRPRTDGYIRWESRSVQRVNVEYTVNGGAAWVLLSGETDAATGELAWTLPDSEYVNCRVRISDSSFPALADTSETAFSILRHNLDAGFVIDTDLEHARYQGPGYLEDVGGGENIGFALYARDWETASGFSVTFSWDPDKVSFRTMSSTNIADEEIVIRGQSLIPPRETNILGNTFLTAGARNSAGFYTNSFAVQGGPAAIEPDGLIYFAVFRTAASFAPGDTLSIRCAVQMADQNGLVRDLGVRFFRILPEILPPANLIVSDVPGDQGHGLKLTWTASPSEQTGLVSCYRIYRSLTGAPADSVRALNTFTDIRDVTLWERHAFVLVDSVAGGTAGYIDTALGLSGVPYYYWIQAVGADRAGAKVAAGIPVFAGERNAAPVAVSVGEARPNPFNPSTMIEYSLARDAVVLLRVYNISGRRVATLAEGTVSAGTHTVVWDARGMPSGVYFYRFESCGLNRTGKMLLLK